MKRRRSKSRAATHIPEPVGDDWLDIPDGRVWLPAHARDSAGFSIETPAPLLTGPDWTRVHDAMDFLLSHTLDAGTKYRIEWNSRVGSGLSKSTSRAEVVIHRGHREEPAFYTVSQIHSDANPEAGERMAREMRVLEHVRCHAEGFSVPEPVAILWTDHQMFGVTEFVFGLPVDFKRSRRPPWEIVGPIAAELHHLRFDALSSRIPGFDTRRAHTLSMLSEFDALDTPEIIDVRSWITSHLPPDDPPTLTHGDLLGQNILLTEDDIYALLDWEFSEIGDPAYDLAIVTRGARKPFGRDDGRSRLLDQYKSCGGQNVSETDINVYELLFCLGWYQNAFKRESGDHAPEHYLTRLRNMLKRLPR